METITLFHPTGHLQGEVKLPQSKSLLNRYQVLQFLYPHAVPIDLNPDSDDARALWEGLRTLPGHGVDVGPAGTALRFLTAVYAVTDGERMLRGNERLNSRPMEPLIAALRHVGAHIVCTAVEGHAPLLIKGQELQGGVVEMPAGVSSQFLSALAMVAPRMADGLTVEWKDKPVSAPYLNMTLALLRRLGCTVELHDQGFSISGPVNNVLDVPVEPDWSSGGMVYALAAVAPKAEVTLVGLSEQSLQGDAACAPLFERLGLHTQFTRQGAVLTKKQGFSMQPHMEVDFLDCPDLAQPFAMAAGLLGVGARLTGLQTLQGKETRRLDALVNELSALGIHAEAGHDVLILHPGSAKQPLEVRPTYGDHRMAMAMAAAGLRFPLSLENPRVVGKSFPGFWEALHNLGFQLTR